jgi:predicted Rossmann fold flavoprotein
MTTATQAFDVIMLGAGAAGLMCALTAGQRGRKVLLLDHADRVGAKILISGGGRCNFTNLNSAPDRFVSGNPDFCKSALGRYTAADFISLVERHCIPYHEKTLGQLFCDDSARAIVAMLLAECAQGGVDVRVGHTVTDISRSDCFRLDTGHGCFTASALVLATGGLSIPKMGATGFAYDVAHRFGLGVTERLPGLVPLKATPETLGFDRLLAGVSLEAIVSCAGQNFRENILFTHCGLSGPAILQISSYWRLGIRSRSTYCRRTTPTAFCSSVSPRVPGPKRRLCLPRSCPLVSRTRWPRHGCRRDRWQMSLTVPSWPLRHASNAGRFNQQARRGGPRLR